MKLNWQFWLAAAAAAYFFWKWNEACFVLAQTAPAKVIASPFAYTGLAGIPAKAGCKCAGH